MSAPASSISIRKLGALLAAAITAHNLEEWLTWRSFEGASQDFREALGFARSMQPSWPETQIALVLVTIAPVALLVWANTGPHSKAKVWATSWIAAIFLINVFIPHVPQSVLAGGYSPGLLTATLVNFPLCLAIIYRSAKQGLLAPFELAAILVAGLVSLPLVIALAYAVANAVGH